MIIDIKKKGDMYNKRSIMMDMIDMVKKKKQHRKKRIKVFKRLNKW